MENAVKCTVIYKKLTTKTRNRQRVICVISQMMQSMRPSSSQGTSMKKVLVQLLTKNSRAVHNLLLITISIFVVLHYIFLV